MQGPFEALPGADLVALGVDDLAAGRMSVAALLVSRASVGLRACGAAEVARSVVPGDLAGGRYVSGVVAVKLGKPGS